MTKSQHRNLLDLNDAVEIIFDPLFFLVHLNTNRSLFELKGPRVTAESLLYKLEKIRNYLRGANDFKLYQIKIFHSPDLLSHLLYDFASVGVAKQ